MNFYLVIPDLKLPNIALTYFSEQILLPGQLVDVPIQSREVMGVVINQSLESENIDRSKIKPISKVYPYIFSQQWLQMLQLFSQNTFNTLNLSLHSFLQPLKILTLGDWQQLSLILKTELKSNQKDSEVDSNQTKPSINYHLETDYILRIIYIIRNLKLNSQTLIVFPEKKQLNSIWNKINQNPEFQSIMNANLEIKNLIFSGDTSASSKQTVRIINNLIETKKHSKPDLTQEGSKTKSSYNHSTQIVWTTRSGIFLPFKNLAQIILIDEASSFHIQEQNRVYFDTRDAVFLMHMAFGANLDFISTLPSSRLHNFNSNQLSDNTLNNLTGTIVKTLKIKVTTKNRKFDQFELFGNQIVSLLEGEEDFVVGEV